jgi:pantetheine-phosphate adenylyltransferase
MNKKALYAGSFDPFTNGHADIVNRAIKIFEELTIVIATSPTKKPLLSLEDRVKVLNEMYKNEPKVKIDTFTGLIVDYAKDHGIMTLLRGLRPTGDFENEFQMASMNRKLYPGSETIFLNTDEKTYYISSSLVKEIHGHGGDISSFVPEVILRELKK